MRNVVLSCRCVPDRKCCLYSLQQRNARPAVWGPMTPVFALHACLKMKAIFMVQIPSPPEARQRLIEIVKRRSFQRGNEMKLASGRTSTFYFNMKPTMLDPEGGYLTGLLVLDLIKQDDAQLVGGLEMGAVPLATSVATVSYAQGTPIAAFFVRKKAKEHGTQALLEGLAKGETIDGRRIVVVEDVTTTGGSALKAVAAIGEAGGVVTKVVTIVDRQEGAASAFAEAGIPFSALLSLDDFQ